jgi:small-conductance mechanosensitive channel
MQWDSVVYGNTLGRWATALGLALAALAVAAIVKRLLFKRLSKLARHTEARWDDALVGALGATSYLLVVALAVHIGTRLLELPERVDRVLGNVAVLAIWLQVGLWIGALIGGRLHHGGLERQLSVLGIVLRGFVWLAVILLALSNIGVNVTAAIAGLGVGGIAVALAVQNVLGDLLASLSIVLDKPFVIGDFIVVDDYQGTVEHIGVKTTRLRSLSGEQLVFANSDLLKSRLRNYKRMRERRALFGFGLLYETDPEQLAAVPALVRAIVEAQPRTRFDRAHFKGFGNFSLDYEVVYWMLDPDYNRYMDVQQAINLALLKGLSERGIGFAYPTQTLNLPTPLRIAPAATGTGRSD